MANIEKPLCNEYNIGCVDDSKEDSLIYSKTVQVKIEVCHVSKCMPVKRPNGHTHQWSVFVRGIEGADITNFVEKVVYKLPERYKKPRRVCRHPPYKIDETGYGSFVLPVEIYFGDNGPSKHKLEYNVKLQPMGMPPYNSSIVEPLTFMDPSEDFEKRLLKAGASFQHDELKKLVTIEKSLCNENNIGCVDDSKKDNVLYPKTVQVPIEVCHVSKCMSVKRPNGHTHQWSIFVRGVGGADITNFVEKVIYKLPKSYKKPRRVCRNPPYKIDETGYGSFMLPVEIYFGYNGATKHTFEYNVKLQPMGMPPYNSSIVEPLTFVDPPEEFEKRLLKAGACFQHGDLKESTTNKRSLPNENSGSDGGSKKMKMTEK